MIISVSISSMGIGTALSSIISIFFIINILLHQQFFLLQRRRRPSADLPKWCGHPVLVSLQNSGWKDRKSTRLNSSHVAISYAVFCLKKKNYKLLVS